jgi:transposase
LLLGHFYRHAWHVWPRRRLANRFGVVAVVFAAPDELLHILRRISCTLWPMAASLRPQWCEPPHASSATCVGGKAEAIVLSARELLVRQRTQLVNAVRGHAAEFGVIAANDISQLLALLEAVAAEEAVPEAAKQMLAFLGGQVAQLDGQIAELERRMKQQHKVNPVSQLLAEVPGIGPVSALSLALTIDPGRFKSGRHFAAWLGLVPKEHSIGGRQRLGGISRAGNERLRQLLVLGATTVIRFAKPGSKSASAWLLAWLERKPRKLAAVALANKMARIVWAMMATGEAYRGSKKVATLAAGAAAAA